VIVMQNKALRALGVAAAVIVAVALGGQSGGLNVIGQQIRMIGPLVHATGLSAAGQWLSLIVSAALTERLAHLVTRTAPLESGIRAISRT
jgi:hypothetical protein